MTVSNDNRNRVYTIYLQELGWRITEVLVEGCSTLMTGRVVSLKADLVIAVTAVLGN